MTITVIMSDDAWRKFRSAVSVRLLSGNAYGAIDDVAARIVKAADEGQTTLELKTREERRKEQE